MALIDKASLLMVPSTYEAGKLYNVLPSGNRAPDSTDQNSGYDQTRADFDFDRGSNAAATRIDSNGVLQKYRENKLLQSNQFDTTWSSINTTETSGQADKDGGTDAWLISKSASGARVQQAISFTGVQTFSVYAKANASNWIALWTNVGTSYFDLSSGTKGSTGASTTIGSAMESGGNGWYRCSLIFNTSISNVRIYPADGDLDTSGTSGSIYIQNAQLESGLVATDVLTSGATTAKAGVLVDLPRINYDANGENGSLLLEPSRQNKIQFSEYFGASDWALDGGTQSVTNNYSISPEGVKNAARLQLDKTGTTYSRLYVDAGSVGEATISVYMKSNTSQTQNVGLRYDGTGVNCEVPTEWKRFDLTATSTSVSRFQILLFDSIAGNDETADISIYGAMLEQNVTYPSSYIPNHGESGGVTRAADVASISELQTSSILNGTKGTFLFEGIKKRDWYFTNFVITTDGSNTNKSLLIDNSGSAIRLRAWDASSSLDTTIITSSLSNGTFKYLIRWDNGNLKVFINGVSAGTASINAYSYTTLNLKEGSWSNNSLKQLIGFNEALTDAECVTLTTL